MNRHVPVRSCIGCGARGPRSTLVRITRDQTAELRIDRSRRAPGRGAYLHPARECWVRFSRRKGTVRSLGAAVDRTARRALLETFDRAGVR